MYCKGYLFISLFANSREGIHLEIEKIFCLYPCHLGRFNEETFMFYVGCLKYTNCSFD